MALINTDPECKSLNICPGIAYYDTLAVALQGQPNVSPPSPEWHCVGGVAVGVGHRKTCILLQRI